MRRWPRSARSFRPLRRFVLLGVLAAVAAGCGAVGRVTSGDPATGKTLFIAKCGACHTLAAAKTTGTIGPNLDDAFRADKSPSFASAGTEQTIRDIVRGQIAYPDTDPGTSDPKTGAPYQGMTANLLHGQQARDVAVFVAKCADVPTCTVSASG
jgi:mono/diheme cytochrome c family protein